MKNSSMSSPEPVLGLDAKYFIDESMGIVLLTDDCDEERGRPDLSAVNRRPVETLISTATQQPTIRPAAEFVDTGHEAHCAPRSIRARRARGGVCTSARRARLFPIQLLVA